MWAEIVKEMEAFSSAVLTSTDTSKYPFSVRCKPKPDISGEVLRVELPTYMPVQPGPAGMLFHSHDESLWNLKSMSLRGLLDKDSQGWFFRPLKYTPGAGIGGMMALLKFVRDGRRNTRKYLEKRNLPRPAIDWHSVHAIWSEIHGSDR